MSQPSLEYQWVDGGRFYDWLLEVCPWLQVDTHLSDTQARALRRWKSDGCMPDAYGTVDAICVAVGLSLDDIPDELWLKARRSRGKKPWERQRALELVSEGWFPPEAARLVGVDVRTVRRWQELDAA